MSNKTVLWSVVLCAVLSLAAFTGGCKKSTPQEPSGSSVNNQTPAEPAPKPVDNTKSEQPVETTKPSDTEKPKLAPVAIELPKPMFQGTPQNITGVSNLEKPLGHARPPFLAPIGTVNVARGRSVTASDPNPIMGELLMITDGDKEASDGSYVEFGLFKQWVTIDLEAQCDIYAILVWHFHKQAAVYFDVVVQVSSDPDFIEATTVFNNDIDNTLGLGAGKDMNYVETAEGRLIDAKGVRGRYVRLYSNGNSANDLNHYIEVEVFGKPVK